MFPIVLGRFVGRLAGHVAAFVQEAFGHQENPSPERAFYEASRDAAMLLPLPAAVALPGQLWIWGGLTQRLLSNPALTQQAAKDPLVRSLRCFTQVAHPENPVLFQPIGLQHSFQACMAQ
ncbi:MAG: hypothetical protein U1F66_08520 [bacterium]